MGHVQFQVKKNLLRVYETGEIHAPVDLPDWHNILKYYHEIKNIFPLYSFYFVTYRLKRGWFANEKQNLVTA